MSDLRQLNVDLARVLGVHNISNVRSVKLELRANDVPTVTVERHFLPGNSGNGLVDGIQTVTTVHKLVPSEPKEVTAP